MIGQDPKVNFSRFQFPMEGIDYTGKVRLMIGYEAVADRRREGLAGQWRGVGINRGGLSAQLAN